MNQAKSVWLGIDLNIPHTMDYLHMLYRCSLLKAVDKP